MSTIFTVANERQVITYPVQLYVFDCGECGLPMGVPDEWLAERRKDGGSIHCPAGHKMSYHRTDLDRAQDKAKEAEKRAAWAESRADRLRMERDAEQRSARAYRGHVTRLRDRIANGVCPVQSCRRNFANVKAHVESQHPDWAHDHPEALA